MRARRSGYILNVSSIGGLMGSSATATYCASKFAVEGLSEGLAQEVAEFGIKVMIVEPGHDAWTVGREPCVMLDWQGAINYAKPTTGTRTTTR